MTKPKTYSFTLFLKGADVLLDESLDALYEAGCDDAVFGERDGAQYAAFDREAKSFTEALKSAIVNLTSTVDGLHVARVAPEEFVTLAAIAERAGLSREYVRLLANQERGPGGSRRRSLMQTTRHDFGTGRTSPSGCRNTRRARPSWTRRAPT